MEIQRWTDLVVAPIRLAAWLGLSSSDIVGVIVAPIARFAKSTVLVPFPRHWRASRRRGPGSSTGSSGPRLARVGHRAGIDGQAGHGARRQAARMSSV